jgi:mono/diheme cytochrome c family protein
MRIPTVREPIAAALTPDGKWLFVANHLPAGRADTGDISIEVTAINTRSRKRRSIRLPNGSTSARGIAISPDGRHVYVTHILARYQMPTTQVDRGWMNTNALSVLDARRRRCIATVLLDDVDRGAANPWGVALSNDGHWILVAHSGTDELSVIDARALHERLRNRAAGRPNPVVGPEIYAGTSSGGVAEDLSFLVGLRTRVPLPGKGPRGLAVAGDTAFVAEYFSDTVAAATVRGLDRVAVKQLALAPAPQLSERRRGEMLFHDAKLCFQGWQTCSSCHPDGRSDALNWDLLNDGIGNPKNSKTMLHAHRTPPAMSLGVRDGAEAAVRAGIRHIQFAERPEEDARAIDEYLKSLTPIPSPALHSGNLTEAAQRGRELFLSDSAGCGECHPEPLYTDRKSYDVESRGLQDRTSEFDTPALVEVWRTAPYNHDGRYPTIRDLLVEGKHGGATGKLSEKQMADLVAFVSSL